MTADPNTHEDDATNQGVSTTEPAEGDDDAPAGGGESPEPGVITGETADER
jgi:hypothetical protein